VPACEMTARSKRTIALCVFIFALRDGGAVGAIDASEDIPAADDREPTCEATATAAASP